MEYKNWQSGIYGGKIVLTEERFERLRTVLERELSLPVFNQNSDKDMETVVQRIIDFF